MINIEAEEMISVTDAAKSLPGRPNVATLWRWSKFGVYGVKLETILIGNRRFTSREALQRFIVATNAAADGDELGLQSDRPTDDGAAQRELAEMGI